MGRRDKIVAHGPEVYLTPQASSRWAGHARLGTNATKHGALSSPSGLVRIAGRAIPRIGVDVCRNGWPARGPPNARASVRWCSSGSGRRSTGYSTDFRPEVLSAPLRCGQQSDLQGRQTPFRLRVHSGATRGKTNCSAILIRYSVGGCAQKPTLLAHSKFCVGLPQISYHPAGGRVREIFHASARDDPLLVSIPIAVLQSEPLPRRPGLGGADPFASSRNRRLSLHEKAYEAVRGKRTPRCRPTLLAHRARLTIPIAPKIEPGRCYDTKRAVYERSRLGWAAQTLESTC